MPRIDPLSLLRCLSVLLGPTGGIKSKEEVHRLANLMTKFSKKLVSKCIYIQILKTTNTDLLSQFMSAGGWNLVHMWLTDGILAKNWALIQELLELLLLCPVDIERLKSNNCPKLVKGLSKEGSHQGVRTLASRLVEQWLKIVKGEAAPNSVPAQIVAIPLQTNATQGLIIQTTQQSAQQQQYSITGALQKEDGESVTVQVQDLQFSESPPSTVSTTQFQQSDELQQQQIQEKQTIQLQVVTKPQQTQQQQISQLVTKKQSFVVVTSQSAVPLYKITIRDGKQVLTKVETDASNINNVLASSTPIEVNGDITNAVSNVKEDPDKGETDSSEGVYSEQGEVTEVQFEQQSDQVSSEVKQSLISSKDSSEIGTNNVKSTDNKDNKDSVLSDSNKSSDKENRDSHKKDDKKTSSVLDKKSSSHHHNSSSSSKSSKHSSSSSHRSSSSSSHRSSSHRSSSSSSKSSSSKDKSSRDKHHSSNRHSSSSKSKSDKEKEREKEKQKKDQAEKDKATLEKIQGQALSSKVGKIPKKKLEEGGKSGDASKRSPTESRDSSKENKDKAETKKATTIPEKKNISISIESRKNTQDATTRPKTVKTFNSKFRSTGLEEEAKPPPPRSAKKVAPVVDKKIVPLPKLPVLKRPSPLREVIAPSEKKAKLSLESPTTPPTDEKKGGIKLIPPKPKPMGLQESDMFMDALTASTKSKEPRKRKRRTSISKDGPSETKKQETANSDNRDVTPPPTSPPSADEKSPVVVKPNFKFYQDTLETDEDKEQKEKDSADEESRRERDEDVDNLKDRDDEDTGSNTPTPEDDADEKGSDGGDVSPDGLDILKKDSSSPNPEIRYVDGLRSVLLLQKRKGPKKTLKWKTDLESIRYFELDETERVNVTKTFTDMKQMEKQNEREAFQMARKLSNEDLMEERTRWKPLIPIDLPPPLVEPGKDSREKDIQYAREKGILQALYFNRSMIPDSAAEPDEERHHVMTDPKIIPLDDLTGNKESEKDFTNVPWPEPKPQLPAQPATMTNFHYQTYPHNQQQIIPVTSQAGMNQMAPIPQQMMPPGPIPQMAPEMGGPIPAGGGGWRTGDGKVVVPDVGINPINNMPGAYPQGMESGPMVPPGMMGPPPMYNQQQEGFGMMGPEEMGYNNMNPNNFQGPPGPMFGPAPNFQGPRGAGPMHPRGRGGPGPGWYRGCGPGRGGWRGGGGGWRGNGKQPRVCMQFTKNGYCRVGDKCQYLHPGVNCPPF